MIRFYTRFLEISQAYKLPVDLTAERLLDVIALRHANGSTMTVMQAMSLSDIASPATLHRKIDDLLDEGLIVQRYEGRNRRTKYLVPSVKAHMHFDKLGLAIAEAGVA